MKKVHCLISVLLYSHLLSYITLVGLKISNLASLECNWTAEFILLSRINWVLIKIPYLVFSPVFVYDRNQQNILEVNKTDYEACNSDHPLHNWTTGAGRDVVPLNVTRRYYFLSGKGFCYSGMKMAIQVEKLPPPPSAAPVKSKGSAPLTPVFRSQFVLPAIFAIGAVWDALLRFC